MELFIEERNPINEAEFKGNLELTCVTLEEGVTEIPKNAFRGCANLSEVFIPRTVKRIDVSAFQGCTNLHLYVEHSAEEWVAVEKMPKWRFSVARYVLTCEGVDYVALVGGKACHAYPRYEDIARPEMSPDGLVVLPDLLTQEA